MVLTSSTRCVTLLHSFLTGNGDNFSKFLYKNICCDAQWKHLNKSLHSG